MAQNDSYFSSQWALPKMEVQEAWIYGTGSGIKIAIIDEGVDLSHPDLTANILPGYDATGQGSAGAATNNDNHGTACAGIVAAVTNNSLGIAGVAPNAKIIPIRAIYRNAQGATQRSRAWEATAIDWAVANGADVISCSWGFHNSTDATAVVNAITNAVTNGRNGKGCIVLMATGNSNGALIYSATLSNVIAVGASTTTDQREPISNFGTGLDVVAPGVNIYTTDLQGAAGIAGDYMSNFSNTSAACPNAAGVVALMLSVNPNLTYQEVRTILTQTSDPRTGQTSGSWVSDVGYGRVNANRAVMAACDNLKLTLTISGPATLCDASQPFSIPNLPTGATVSWSVSPISLFAVDTGTGSTFATQPTNASVKGNGTITATVSHGGCVWSITKTIYVGSPTIGGELESGQLMAFSPTINNVCNAVTHSTDMFVYGAPSITWTKVASNPSSVYWSAGSNNLSFRFVSAGQTATFRATATNVCSSTVREFVFKSITCSGGCSQFQVSPNPVSERIHISTPIEPCSSSMLAERNTTASEPGQEFTAPPSVVLMDALGQVKDSQQLSASTQETDIDVSNLKKGVYILIIQKGSYTERHRIYID